MIRADLKHSEKMPDAREELHRSVREGKIESRHSMKSLKGMGSRSNDLGIELRIPTLSVDSETHSCEEKVAVVVTLRSVEESVTETDHKAMFALSVYFIISVS